jgi:hypothetical protein
MQTWNIYVSTLAAVCMIARQERKEDKGSIANNKHRIKMRQTRRVVTQPCMHKPKRPLDDALNAHL